MKCELCKNDIPKTFLEKRIGTIIKDSKGKKHNVCADCQKRFENDKDRILSELGK